MTQYVKGQRYIPLLCELHEEWTSWSPVLLSGLFKHLNNFLNGVF